MVRYVCPSCGETFPSPKRAAEHIRQRHEPPREQAASVATAYEEAFVQSELGGGPGERAYVFIHWATIDDRNEPVGLEVWTVPPDSLKRAVAVPDVYAIANASRRGWPARRPAVISSSMLRRMKIGDLIEKRRAEAVRRGAGAVPADWGPAPAWIRAWAEDQRRTAGRKSPDAVPPSARRGRKPKYTPEYLDKVERVYKAGVANRTPTKAVEERLGVTPGEAIYLVRLLRASGRIGKAPLRADRTPTRKRSRERTGE